MTAWLAFLTSPTPLHAQEGSHSIRGSIRDALGQPVAGALVEIDAAGRSSNTTADGSFVLDDLAPGIHVLSVTKDGYVPRYVRFAVDTDQREGATVDLGTIVLTTLREGAAGLITAVGTITDSETGAPVASVAVGLNGTVVAVTDDRGQFRGVAGNLTRDGDNRLTTQRIGYAPIDRLFRIPPDVSQVEFDVALDPTSVELPTITVEATALSRRLTDTGFYRREKSTSGHFFTAADIEKMKAMYVTDILRRVPGATVLSQQDADLTTGGGVGVRFLRSGFICRGTPTVYVDRVRVPASNLDLIRNPDRLAGLEVYTSGAATPPEYATGGNCGAIVLWTKDALGLNEPSPFQLGAHVGASFANGSSPDRLGGQLTIPFRGPLLVYIGFTQRTGGGRSGSAWQAFLSMQVKPFGTQNPFYGAMGVALNKPQLVMKAHHLVIAGFAVPVDLGPLRPFTEFHVTGPLTGQPQAFGFAGINLRINAN